MLAPLRAVPVGVTPVEAVLLGSEAFEAEFLAAAELFAAVFSRDVFCAFVPLLRGTVLSCPSSRELFIILNAL